MFEELTRSLPPGVLVKDHFIEEENLGRLFFATREELPFLLQEVIHDTVTLSETTTLDLLPLCPIFRTVCCWLEGKEAMYKQQERGKGIFFS